MKPPLLGSSLLLFAAALPALSASASAVVLLTDNFTVTSNSQNLNQELAGRQTGTLAPALYTSLGTQHQVGNGGTNVGQPGGASNSNFALLAYNSSFQSTIDIGATALGPVTISYDMYLRGANPGPDTDPTFWAAFSLRATGDSFPVAGAGEFGLLVRVNGGVQIFQNGSGGITPAGWDTPGFALSDNWTLTFTDTVGTGSAFNGNGSVVTIVNGTTTLGTITLSQLNSTGLEMGFRNYNGRFAGIDNLSLSTVPEASAAAVFFSLAGFATLRRRRRGI